MAAAVAVVTALPVVYLVLQATDQGWSAVVAEVWRRRVFDLALRSIGLAAVVTAVSLIIGIAAAYAVVRTDVPGARVFRVVMALPLSLPSYVAAYAWVSWKPGLANFWGAVLVLSSVSFPFVYLPVAAALRRLDATHEEVARSLGRTPRQVAFGLTVRQVRPAAAAGGLLVMLYVLSDFGAVATMRYESFTWVIFGAYRAGFNPSRAAVLSLVLIVLALVFVVAEASARGRGAAAHVGAGAPRPARTVHLGAARWPVLAFMVSVAVATLVMPLGLIGRWVVQSNTDVDVPAVLGSLWATVTLALATTVATVALAAPVALLAARLRSWWAQGIERTTFVAHALPGVVIAIAMVFVGVRVTPGLYQRLPLLVVAYVVLFASLAVGAIRASVEQTPAGVDDVARTLGLSPLQVAWRVNLPLAWPGIMAGAGLVFLATMKELPATLLLRPTEFETLSTEMWTNTAVNDYAGAAPYAVLLVLVSSVPAMMLSMQRTSRTTG
jgi:iron(III) transport system permease protein